ncbi:MAG: MATE family efflux transporter [Oscillospiraceae bacterium]|nr:MATE family efflux transporter [Oscillospiraceae bacterium]
MTTVIAFQNAIVFAVNLADNIMLSQYSEAALSGVSLVNQIQYLLQMLVMGISEGALIFASRSWGEKDTASIKSISNIALKFSISVSMILGLIMLFFPSGILGLLSDSTKFVSEGTKYAVIIAFSYPIFAISRSLLMMLRSVETVKIGFYVSLSTLIINICLNYLLIYGNLGFPEMGVRGAAFATLISRIIEMIVIAFFVFKTDKKVRLKLSDLIKPSDREQLKGYIKHGSPVFLSSLTWGIAMAFQTAILGHMGENAISANAVSSTVFQIVSVFLYGSASASSVIISKMIGEGKTDMIKPCTRALQLLFLGFGLATGVTLFILRIPILTLYTKLSPASANLALNFMTVLSFTSIGTAYQMPVLTGIVRSGGETDFVLKNDLIFMWLIILPASVLCAFIFKFPPLAVYACLKCDQILKCSVAAIKVNRYKWIKKIR